jgi:3'-phosphoadenosine 5'-phosphosulfate sulfotransferase (PAPS reductase)/FAD synthetase
MTSCEKSEQLPALAPSTGWAPLVRPSGRVVARFSCGAASAVATKLACKKYGDAVEIYYTDTGAEHPDNTRFRHDCARWFGREVKVLKSDKYKDIWDVFEKQRFLVGPNFAPCTSKMKRIPGDSIWQLGDTEIFGYTADERHRVERWKAQNNERIIECPLIDLHLTKDDCLGMLERVGIEIPVMYRLGFRNNNCIGCVKARDNLDYWKRVRKHFPEVFARMAKLERELETTINRVTKDGVRSEIYLDAIEAGDPKGSDPWVSCGLFCMAEADGFGKEPDHRLMTRAVAKRDENLLDIAAAVSALPKQEIVGTFSN